MKAAPPLHPLYCFPGGREGIRCTMDDFSVERNEACSFCVEMITLLDFPSRWVPM